MHCLFDPTASIVLRNANSIPLPLLNPNHSSTPTPSQHPTPLPTPNTQRPSKRLKMRPPLRIRLLAHLTTMMGTGECV
ncbi:hypothetical protein Hypma_001878 [Hypsizygus marmoreus]|uniref:Uncharacterized protein n=1 Tax=Hypsizygus marmoreus TaxID=39966 RepID=A0A369J9U6_HYPMA|nr:hypothetical protein Hypma_001878 [Hypsizygus marmoreus]